jgi:dipeptidase D
MVAVYEEMFGKAPVLDVTHGGLECGLFSDGIKGLDAVSIGPDIQDIHSFRERLSISSSRRLYEFMIKLLAELK